MIQYVGIKKRERGNTGKVNLKSEGRKIQDE